MTDPTPSADLPTTADQRAADAQYYRRVLHEIIDMGADLARALHQQGTAPVSGEPGAERAPDVTGAFDRVARTVRRTILLAQKVGEPVRPRVDHAGRRRVAARRHVLRCVENVIGRKASGDAAERLQAELLERLDAPELAEQIEDRPPGEIIEELCEDLGLSVTFGVPDKRRTPADAALLSARAAAGVGDLVRGDAVLAAAVLALRRGRPMGADQAPRERAPPAPG